MRTHTYTHTVTHTHTCTDSSIPYSQLHHHISQPSTSGPDTAAGPSLPAALLPKQLVAEALYIARPLVHSKITVFPRLLLDITTMSYCPQYVTSSGNGPGNKTGNETGNKPGNISTIKHNCEYCNCTPLDNISTFGLFDIIVLRVNPP